MRLFHLMAPVLLALPFATAAAEPVRVTGRVLDAESMTGMTGARIEIFPAWEDYGQVVRRLEAGTELKPLATTRPEEDGSFEVAAPEAGAFRLAVRPRVTSGTLRISVQAPGFAASETAGGGPSGGEGMVEILLGSVDER